VGARREFETKRREIRWKIEEETLGARRNEGDFE